MFGVEMHTSTGKPYISKKTFTTASGETCPCKCVKVYAFDIINKKMAVFDSITYAAFGLRVNKSKIFTHNCIDRGDGTFWVCYKIRKSEDEEKLINLINDPKINVYKYMYDHVPEKIRLKYAEQIKELQIDRFLANKRLCQY